MKVEKAKRLLEKYLSGVASTEEQEKIDSWYSSIEFTMNDEAHRKQLAGEHIKRQLQLRTNSKPKFTILRPWIGVAAALVIILLAQFFYKKSESNRVEGQLTIVSATHGDRSLSLPDGSLVTLKAQSTIAYPKHFSATERKITLREGEAFFDVHHEENRAFVVNTATNLSIKVLGTSFLVQSFSKQKHVSVKVSTGKVEVSRLQKKIGLLTRGDQLVFDKVTNSAILNKLTSVKAVPILFSGSRIGEVAAKVAYTYNINLLIGPSVDPNLKTTAKFNSSLDIEELLSLICKLHHLKYSVSADKTTYTIYK